MFKEYSYRIIVLAFKNILIVLILYFLNLSNYRIYTGLIVLMNFLLLIWYLYTYRDIVFGPHDKLLDEKTNIISFFKYGIILLLANLSTTLVLTVNKQVVEIFFSVEEFGMYSFAYSMLAIITVIVSAVSVVLYPTFKKITFKKLILQYSHLNGTIILIVMIGLIGYFPLQWLIPRFLPEYKDSLVIFRIALPGLLFSSSISAIKHNYFKVTNKNNHYFYISFCVILFNIAINLFAYYYYNSLVSITISSIFGLMIWYITTEIYMVKKYGIKWKSNAILLLFAVVFFYSITAMSNFLVSGAIYTLLIGLTIVLTNKEVIFNYIRKRYKKHE
jgi:O-antigen/teichoic acid export membrane protein